MRDDSDDVVDEEEVEAEMGVMESEDNIAKEHWLVEQEPTLPKEDSFSEPRNERVTFQLQPGFPESLTTEDRPESFTTRSSMHTVGSLTRGSTTDSFLTTSERKRRHRPSVYDPPTFHS